MQTIINDPGDFSYVIGPYKQPVATVSPGETFIVETADAFENRITSPDDDITQIITLPYVNPLTGPIYVEGAEKGDTVAVTIHSIEVTRNYGVSALIPEFGGLCGTVFTRTLNPPLPPRVMLHPISNGEITFSEDLDIAAIPYEPFYGTIGTAPELEAISSLAPGFHGGNMDAADVCPGNTIHLPVNVPGALLHIGDGHAAQGDAEVCGVATEIPTRGTLTVDLIKGQYVATPASRVRRLPHDSRQRPPYGGRRPHRLLRTRDVAGIVVRHRAPDRVPALLAGRARPSRQHGGHPLLRRRQVPQALPAPQLSLWRCPIFKPTDEFFDANGVRLHYTDWGTPAPDAPAIVLLHGLQDCARSWDIFAAAIRSDYRVIALDHRGHGDSAHATPETYGFRDYISDLESLVSHLALEATSFLSATPPARATPSSSPPSTPNSSTRFSSWTSTPTPSIPTRRACSCATTPSPTNGTRSKPSWRGCATASRSQRTRCFCTRQR